MFYKKNKKNIEIHNWGKIMQFKKKTELYNLINETVNDNFTIAKEFNILFCVYYEQC